MKVSVAIATYNGGRYLREQLDSIASQTLLPAEVIICDDGSSDDTVAIARRFAAEVPFEVSVDAHGERLGFTANFVRAVGLCTGEIVALCDQDDVWKLDKLAATIPCFVDASVMTVTHRVEVVDERLRPTGLMMPEGGYHGAYTLFSLDPWWCPNGMQFLFRSERIIPWLSRTPPLSAYGFGTAPFDEWIFYLGLLSGRAIVLEESLGLWRRHDSALTRKVDALQEESTAAHHLRLALHSGAEAYAFRAGITDSRADFADQPVASADGTPLSAVAGAAEFYREMSRMFRRREGLHDPRSRRFHRLCTFRRMLMWRDYRSRDTGGLGAKAVAKDLFTVLFGPRSSGAMQDAGAGR